MFRRKKKSLVIAPQFVHIDKGYFDLSFEEQREFLRSFLGSMSPNEEVRKKAQEEAKRPKNES